MFKKIAAALILITAQSKAEAALSAYYQSTREICDLIQNEDLSAILGQKEPISEIKLIEDASEYRIYQVCTSNCCSQVKVTYVPNSKIGPKKYEILTLEQE